MKQKLLTLFVLLVSAMTAFADAKGSGVTKGNDINKNGISYEYQITEQDGDVTFTVTPNLDGIIGYVATYIDDESHLPGDYETKGTARTWKGLAKGTELKIKGWFDAAGGRMYFNEVTYIIGTEAAPDPEKPDNKFNITTSGNVAKVVGPVTAAEVEQINDVDVMNIDLTGVKSIENGVTIQPLRKNAIIVISGTYKEEKINEETVCTTTADSKYDAIKDMNNVVVLAADNKYHPLKQLEFVDIPGEPLWTGGLKNIISTGNTGWKVTRTIPAHTHATVCVTNLIVNIPANLRAWEAVDYDETTGIKFNKANVIGANFPYVVRNATDEDTDLSFTGTNDLNFKTFIDTEANKHQVGSTNIYFCGNWKEALVTDGTQWIIKNEGIHASIVKAHGVKISPFRAYFTGIPEGASAKLNFDDDETTGITNVNAAESNDDTLYNLAGQKVNAAYKGIVIKNGKKYLVK